MPELDPEQQREFAVDVVRRLRGAGHQAYWAGGCVRDRLLGLRPKDYDVATSALPSDIRDLFGRRRTLAIGAAFGVITVLGDKAAGAIEVATFRRDVGYSDGRRPDAVAFSTAEEDAQRRDFTINGLFFDPLAGEVHDFVAGRADLERRVIRAIGDPAARFDEDKLRLLRALRFAAKFDFALDPATHTAIVALAPTVSVVSPERIAAELRAMFAHASRGVAARRLHEAGLLVEVLPELADRLKSSGAERAFATLVDLADPPFAVALAALLAPLADAETADAIGRRLRLSNRERTGVDWLVEHHDALRDARRQGWPRVQRLLAHAAGVELLHLAVAMGTIDASDAEFCRDVLARPRADWDPPALVNGDDLLRLGIPAGKHFQTLLEDLRDAQLEGRVNAREEALRLARELWPQKD